MFAFWAYFLVSVQCKEIFQCLHSILKIIFHISRQSIVQHIWIVGAFELFRYRFIPISECAIICSLQAYKTRSKLKRRKHNNNYVYFAAFQIYFFFLSLFVFSERLLNCVRFSHVKQKRQPFLFYGVNMCVRAVDLFNPKNLDDFVVVIFNLDAVGIREKNKWFTIVI